MLQTNFPETFRAAEAKFLDWALPEASLFHSLQKACIDILAQNEVRGFSPAQVEVRTAPLPFYPGARVTAFTLPGVGQDLFFLETETGLGFINGTNEILYDFNERHPTNFEGEACVQYLRFFFCFVHGQLGRFQIVETLDDIHWRTDAPMESKKEAASYIMPITARGVQPDGLWRFTATIVFKGALFKADIFMAKQALSATIDPEEPEQDFTLGQNALGNEMILLENLPVELTEPMGRPLFSE